ncbi:hypothetical protein L1049_003640 [Liquidambar formosana]|uniref:DUF4283 domain-containing protein n=1 Tax=Liquidambar formosana TaxID=63359 RepID=A0AAP0RM42_LIQFO
MKEEEADLFAMDDSSKGKLENCTYSLMGKVLTEKSFNKKALRNTLRLMWNVGNEVKIEDVGDNLLLVKFQDEFQMRKVIDGDPWMFDNHLILLRRWEQGMHVKIVVFQSVTIYIQIWGLPFKCRGKQIAEDMRRRMGD